MPENPMSSSEPPVNYAADGLVCIESTPTVIPRSVCGQFDDSPEDILADTFSPDFEPYGESYESPVCPTPSVLRRGDINGIAVRDRRSSVVSPSTSWEQAETSCTNPEIHDNHLRQLDVQTKEEVNNGPMEGRLLFPDHHTSSYPCSEMTPSVQERLAVIEETMPLHQPNKATDDQGVETSGITTVSNDDVLCGRGGKTNNHRGNRQYRELVDLARPEYFAARKPRKAQISHAIVKAIRAAGGRFLKLDKDTNTYHDVGDAKAVEKTSQALREGAAQKIRDIMSTKSYSPTHLDPSGFGVVSPKSHAYESISYPRWDMEGGNVTSVLRSPKKRWLEDWEMSHASEDSMTKRQRVSASE